MGTGSRTGSQVGENLLCQSRYNNRVTSALILTFHTQFRRLA